MEASQRLSAAREQALSDRLQQLEQTNDMLTGGGSSSSQKLSQEVGAPVACSLCCSPWKVPSEVCGRATVGVVVSHSTAGTHGRGIAALLLPKGKVAEPGGKCSRYVVHHGWGYGGFVAVPQDYGYEM